MSTPSPLKLKVVTAGKRCSMDVRSARAADLLAFLRRHGISSDTPEPSCSGTGPWPTSWSTSGDRLGLLSGDRPARRKRTEQAGTRRLS